MGKLFNAMILGTGITIALLLFNGGGQNPTSLILMLLNPSSYSNSAFYLLFNLAGIATISGGILIGVAAIIKQDWLMRAGFIGVLSSIVIAPFVDLWKFIYSQTNYLGIGQSFQCTTSPLCNYIATGGMGQIIALVIAGPLILYALWASINYIWTGESNG